jgi:hydrogenase maturation protease
MGLSLMKVNRSLGIRRILMQVIRQGLTLIDYGQYLILITHNFSTTQLMKTTVLGLGNTLLKDEGIGVHVLHALREREGDDSLELIDGGTLSFTLSPYIEDAERLIVIDAAELKRPAGSVACLEADEMDDFVLGNRKRSVHEVSLMDLLAIARLNGCLPDHRALIAVQPHSVDWGEAPTPRVAEAIPRACAAIDQLIQRWQS